MNNLPRKHKFIFSFSLVLFRFCAKTVYMNEHRLIQSILLCSFLPLTSNSLQRFQKNNLALSRFWEMLLKVLGIIWYALSIKKYLDCKQCQRDLHFCLTPLTEERWDFLDLNIRRDLHFCQKLWRWACSRRVLILKKKRLTEGILSERYPRTPGMCRARRITTSREEDTVCSVVHIIVSRDVISEIHTRDTQVSYVTNPCY